MPGLLMSLPARRLPAALGRVWKAWGGCPIALQGGGRKSPCGGGGAPLCRVPVRWVLVRGLRSWAARPLLAMAAKVDLTTATDWKEAKSFLKGLNNKQKREHYYTKEFVKLKNIPTWKEMAKSARVKQPEEAVYPKDNQLNEKISLFRGDITKLEVDAIVNAGDFFWTVTRTLVHLSHAGGRCAEERPVGLKAAVRCDKPWQWRWEEDSGKYFSAVVDIKYFYRAFDAIDLGHLVLVVIGTAL
ncbi:hypothetical protein lerEdw1_007370 [Lerista edwardsae]|nr:hypothetical protein lerEdw1_007370 [Lerista edwardsae]